VGWLTLARSLFRVRFKVRADRILGKPLVTQQAGQPRPLLLLGVAARLLLLLLLLLLLDYGLRRDGCAAHCVAGGD
jgi:hypothetical protein